MEKVCVLGLGYIGLPTAAMFATHGMEVVGVDISDHVIETLSNGGIHIQERGLEELVHSALGHGSLRVSNHPEEADVFIIAVPTPICTASHRTWGALPEETGAKFAPRADLTYVIAAAESLIPYLKPGNLIVLESTVPPRTTTDCLAPIIERSGLVVSGGRRSEVLNESLQRVFLAHCPERVLPGRILEELQENDRIIGGVDSEAGEKARLLYETFVNGRIFLTDATTAEMAKLMENTFRDVNIALANEFALAAEQVGINVWEAIELANRHPRVSILNPGPGVGGHCIAVDPWFIVQAAPEVTPLIQVARTINDEMPRHVVELVRMKLTGIDNPVVTCLGLAYKANVGDTRESPALAVVRELQAMGLDVRIYDPHVPMGLVPGQTVTVDEALEGSDCLVFLTDHKAFNCLSRRSIQRMRHRLLIDTRNARTKVEWADDRFDSVLLGSK